MLSEAQLRRGYVLIPKELSWRKADIFVKRGWGELNPFHRRWLGKLTLTDAGRAALNEQKARSDV